MRIAIDADSNGLDLKQALAGYLKELGYEVEDLAHLESRPEAHYPDVALNLAKRIQRNEFEKGVLICGTGLGMAIAANKLKGVYAGSCDDVYAAERLAKSNNAQVITLGALVTGRESAKAIVKTFVEAEFQGGGSAPKVGRIREIEDETFA